MTKGLDYINGRRGETNTGAPHTVDARILGLCQLACEWCWGPEHMRKGSITAKQWSKTIGRLASAGTEQIVFSGGEPLLSPVLRPGIESAKQEGLRVTLSTNGIRLEQNSDILNMVDDLGIPIDGSTPAVNNKMRKRSDKFSAWGKAVGAVLLAQRMNERGEADVLVTSRTVIAKPNLGDVPNIPNVLANKGVDLETLRMKMYQVEPFGPHYQNIDFEGEWAVTADEARYAASQAMASRPDANITLQLYGGTVGRYFLIDPDGFATGTDEDQYGHPIEVKYGNVVHEFDATLDAYSQHQAALSLSG